jgi:hypothetical protein
MDTKTIYVLVKLVIDADADNDEVVEEADYNFTHPQIQCTEIMEMYPTRGDVG